MQKLLKLGGSAVPSILLNKEDEFLRTSLAARIATADTAAVFGRYSASTAGMAAIPFSEYSIAAEHPSSAPIPIKSAIPKGCPKANKPKRNAVPRNIVNVKSENPNISKAVPP